MKHNSTIIHTAGLLVMGAVLSKLLGFFREILFVHQFGASSITDAYLLTNSIPTVLFSSLAVAVNLNFIPMYMKLGLSKNRGTFTSNLLSIIVVASLLGCLLLNLFPRQVLYLFAMTLADETLDHAIPMLRIVSFSVFPILAQQLFMAYSQANEYFLFTAAHGVILNLMLMVTYVIATQDTYYLLSIGVVSAQFVVMLLMLHSARRAGFHYTLILDFRDSAIHTMFFLTVPLALGKFAEEMSLLVDRNLAASLGTGLLSGLAYAALLANAASSIVMNSITTASFPTFSRLASDGDQNAFSSSFGKYFSVLIFALCPISIFMAVFAEDAVRCILTHGALKATSAKIIWESTACYAFGIVPLGVQNYFVRGFYAFRDTKKPAVIVGTSLLCNIGMSLCLVRFFAHIGISIATSLSYVLASAGLMYCFRRNYGMTVFRSIGRELVLYLVSAAVLSAATYWLFHRVLLVDSVAIRLVSEGVLFFSLYVAILLGLSRNLRQQVRSFVIRWL